MKLRAYQSEAVDAVLREFETRRSTLIVQPTGTGKTVTFAHIADRMKHLGRVKVIAHREELIFQAADKIHAVTGTSPEIEMAEFRADTHMYKRSDVVVSSVQTQIAGNKGAGRMARFDPFAFGLLIIDEAHHATASSYRKVLAHYQQNPNLKVLGVTATPDRADEQALGQVFESVAFSYQLTDAVHDGWLVPITQKSVVVRGLDFSSVRTTAGDLNGKDLAEIMEYERNLHEVASPTIEIAAGRKVLVFATSVAHAERLCEIFNRHRPGAAHWICGETDKDERKRLIGAYSRGEFQFMVNVGVFTEGFDEPTIEVIALARPTKSRSLFCLDAKTEILTDKGWRRIHDKFEAGEQAAAFDTSTGAIRWSPVLASIRRFTNNAESMYRYSSPGLDIRVTDQHRMVFRKFRGRPRIRTAWRFDNAASLSEVADAYEIPVSGLQDAPGVPLTDDEIRFIGWVMTDGSINAVTGGVCISQAEHQPWVDDIEKCLIGCGFKYTKTTRVRQSQFRSSSKCVLFTVSKGKPRGDRKHLRGWGELSPYLDKELSPLLEDMDRRQLGVLLHAMHLGDGSKQLNQTWTRRSYHIATGRAVLADRLQSLCVRRGFGCNVSEQHYNANPIYMVHIKDRQARYIGGSGATDRPRLTKEDRRAQELVWCIQTVTGTIVTRRNGKVAIVGNCQMVGRGTRPLPGLIDHLPEACDRRDAIAASAKPSVEIIDFVGNCGKHKLIRTTDILGGKYSDEVRKRAAKALDKVGGDVAAALEKAHKDIEAEEEAKRQERMRLTAKAEYQTQLIPVDRYRAATSGRLNQFVPEPITDAQRGYLRSRGYKTDGITKRQASAIIGRLKDEQDRARTTQRITWSRPK